MKRLFAVAVAVAALLAATSCKKDKHDSGTDDPGVPSGTIQINDRSETIHGVYYLEEPADIETGKTVGILILGPEGAPGAVEPEFYLSFELSESLCGQTINLAQPLDTQTRPLPYLYISARNGSERFTIDYDEDPIAEVVSEGSLSVTRNGDRFDIRISLNCADGNTLRVEWAGTAVRQNAPF